jgi:hypothetical protein
VRENWIWFVIFGSLAVLLAWSRLAGLSMSFWHDEVYTVVHFAGSGPSRIFSADYIPNNHVLFSLLSWVTTRLLGPSEVAYRFWGVAPAIAATGWLSWWALRRFGVLAGATVLLLMSVSPALFLVTREARGYGIALLAMCGLVIQGDSALRNSEKAKVWPFIVFGTVGVLTLPVFVLPFVFCAIPLVAVRSLRRRILIGITISGTLALSWYSPMLSQIVENSSQEFGEPVLWHSFASMSPSRLVFPIARLLLPGDIEVPPPPDPGDSLLFLIVVHAAFWSLIAIAFVRTWPSDRRPLLWLLVLPIVGTYGPLAAIGAWASFRHVSYLSVPWFALVAIGVGGLVDLVGKMRYPFLVGTAALGVWIVFSFYPVADTVIQTPLENFKEAGRQVNESGLRRVVSNSARPDGLRHYMDPRLELLSAAELEGLFCGQESGYVFIDHLFKSDEVDTACLEAKGEQGIPINQRARGRITLWLVE